MITWLRRANIKDAEGIATIHVASWREAYAGIVPETVLTSLSTPERTEQWRERLGQGEQEAATFVAGGPDEAIFGFGSCGRRRSETLSQDGEIYAIYLLRIEQRQGIGRRLMATMFSHLVQAGFQQAALWVVRENMTARRFYEALGGQVVAERVDQRVGYSLFQVAYAWSPIQLRDPLIQ